MKYVYRAFIFIAVLLLSTALCLGYIIKPTEKEKPKNVGSTTNSESKDKEPKIFRVNAFEGEEPLRIMVVGIDKTATKKMGINQNPSRADTIMLLTLDPVKKKVHLLSIPRDSRINIKGHGLDKINHAYAFGGYNLLRSSVEKFFDINIDHYVTVDYEAVEKLVDAIGGVDMYVPFTYKYEDPSVVPKLVIDFKEGEQHLDGLNAVRFLRARKVYKDADLGRIKAQQEFLMKIFEKMKNPSLVFKLPTLLNIFQTHVDTDLSYGQIADLSYFMLGIDKEAIVKETLRGTDQYIDKISYFLVEKETGRKMLKDFFKDKPVETQQSEGELDTVHDLHKEESNIKHSNQ